MSFFYVVWTKQLQITIIKYFGNSTLKLLFIFKKNFKVKKNRSRLLSENEKNRYTEMKNSKHEKKILYMCILIFKNYG